MEEEFVIYPLALRMKALGYDEPCFGYYVDGELRGVNLGIEELDGIEPHYQRFGFHTLSNHDIDNPNKIVVTAPTYSQAFRFFRKKYNLKSCVMFRTNMEDGKEYYDWLIKGQEVVYRHFKTYEEAELACLQKLIEIAEEIKENDDMISYDIVGQ
jgi:hypothetical protein